MEYVKRTRCLENYTVRTIPSDIITIDVDGNEIIDTSSSRYLYGVIPENKINANFDYILDYQNNPIPNTINIKIFLTQKFDDIGIYTDSIFIDSIEESVTNPNPLTCPEVFKTSTSETFGNYISYLDNNTGGYLPITSECCKSEIVGFPVFWDDQEWPIPSLCREQIIGGSTCQQTQHCFGSLVFQNTAPVQGAGTFGNSVVSPTGSNIKEQCCTKSNIGVDVIWVPWVHGAQYPTLYCTTLDQSFGTLTGGFTQYWTPTNAQHQIMSNRVGDCFGSPFMNE